MIALEALAALPADTLPLFRNGKNLSDQAQIVVTVPQEGDQIVVRATFRRSFGFVAYGIADATEAQRVLALLNATATKTGRSHFEFV